MCRAEEKWLRKDSVIIIIQCGGSKCAYYVRIFHQLVVELIQITRRDIDSEADNSIPGH